MIMNIVNSLYLIAECVYLCPALLAVVSGAVPQFLDASGFFVIKCILPDSYQPFTFL